MIRKIKRVLSNIYEGLYEILTILIYIPFKKKLVQFSIQDQDAHFFATIADKKISDCSTEDYKKFTVGTKDLVNFNFIMEMAFKEYCKSPESKINRSDFINNFKKNYYGQAIFFFIVKWFLILYYRYVQIFLIKEYSCMNKEIDNQESNYWICDIGEKKCKIKEYISTKIIRIVYVIIFDIIFSFVYGLYFLITLKKTNLPKLFVIILQIIEYSLFIILFISLFQKDKCSNKNLLFTQNNDNDDILFFIFEIIVNFNK